MKVSDAVSRIKSAGHDISGEYSDDRCIEFLNTAIQQIASLLIAAKWPALVQELEVHEGETLPQNYMRACGTYPLRMTANVAHIIDGSESVRFRYFATPSTIDINVTDMPYNHDAINDVVVKLAVILALNENEYDVTQDQSILTALQQAMASGMS
jgi:hypothetical protein